MANNNAIGISASIINNRNGVLYNANGVKFKPVIGTQDNIKTEARQNINNDFSGNAKSFGDVLSAVLIKESKLNFSAHAIKRMASRNIQLDAAQHSRLETACSKLSEKGSDEALIILDDKMFLISVKNKTIITALDKNEAGQSVFTNINGAAIA